MKTSSTDLLARPCILLGAGGHARVLLDLLAVCGAQVAGLYDQNPALHGQQMLGAPIKGFDDAVLELDPKSVWLINAIGSAGPVVLRKKIFERFRDAGFEFPTLVHPAACVSRFAVLEPGAQVHAGAIIGAQATIGANTIVNTRAVVEHDCAIAPHVHLAPGVTLSGAVRVGSASHVGTGATVVQGITIGASCLVAAGAVVTVNVADGLSVMGVPAREMAR